MLDARRSVTAGGRREETLGEPPERSILASSPVQPSTAGTTSFSSLLLLTDVSGSGWRHTSLLNVFRHSSVPWQTFRRRLFQMAAQAQTPSMLSSFFNSFCFHARSRDAECTGRRLNDQSLNSMPDKNVLCWRPSRLRPRRLIRYCFTPTDTVAYKRWLVTLHRHQQTSCWLIVWLLPKPGFEQSSSLWSNTLTNKKPLV
jgi:hypothetical protein